MSPADTDADQATANEVRTAFARMAALRLPDGAVTSAEIQRLESLVELSTLDLDEGDNLLLTARDQLQKALAREDLPARDIVSISAELRNLQDKLLAVSERRAKRLSAARTKAKIATVQR